MNIMQFWQLIDQSRSDALGNPEQQMTILTNLLSGLEEADIAEFDRIFSQLSARAYTWPLWGAAYVIGGGCSDDGFMDFRAWLISRGQAVYENALADPESLASAMQEHDGDGQIEGMQYCASQAWETKTGRDSAEFPYADVDHPEEPVGEPWEEDDVEALYPKLARRFV